MELCCICIVTRHKVCQDRRHVLVALSIHQPLLCHLLQSISSGFTRPAVQHFCVQPAKRCCLQPSSFVVGFFFVVSDDGSLGWTLCCLLLLYFRHGREMLWSISGTITAPLGALLIAQNGGRAPPHTTGCTANGNFFIRHNDDTGPEQQNVLLQFFLLPTVLWVLVCCSSFRARPVLRISVVCCCNHLP